MNELLYNLVVHTQIHLLRFAQLIFLTTWLLINAVKHTLLMRTESDYYPMQLSNINLCYITIVMRRAAYFFPFVLLHTHTVIATGRQVEYLVLYNTNLRCENPLSSVWKCNNTSCTFRMKVWVQPLVCRVSSCNHSQNAKLTTVAKLTSDKGKALWRHIRALISFPRMMCNNFIQIRIT